MEINHARTGTLGGTLLIVMSHLGADLLKTALMAATGAVVSFGVSMLLQYVLRRRKR